MDRFLRKRAVLSAFVVVAISATLTISGCGDDEGGEPFSSEWLMEQPRDRWATNGGTLQNQRYSPLDEINDGNVKDLKGKWRVHLLSGKGAKYSGEAQPIAYKDTLYVITGADDVVALDIETGGERWRYEANLEDDIKTVCCGWTNRGVAINGDSVFFGELNGDLVALDRRTGREKWRSKIGDHKRGETITNAPLYYDGTVYTGLSGGEYGIRGRLTAADANTGKEKWRFYTIPGPGEVGHDTWPSDNDSWKTGGAPIWQTPAVDPELGLLYFSTGNAAPDFNGSQREGDNLFAASMVAIDAKTGKYKWHFQATHHDIWDYDQPSPVVLFDQEIDGEERKAIAEAGKTGWVYILDRETGKPIHPINETPVPQEPRQKTAKTQPIPEGDAFTPQEVKPEEAKKYKDFKYVNRGRIFTPFWTEAQLIKPGALGGNNWPPASYNPETGYLYVCSGDQTAALTASEAKYDLKGIARGEVFLGSEYGTPKGSERRGTFTAMNMDNNRIAWQKKWNDYCYSGSLSTGGNLVFAGHNDGNLIAYNAKNGEELWKFNTGAGANATASTFEHNGKQYIAFYSAGNALAGSKKGDSVWLFSLDGVIGPDGGADVPDERADERQEEQDERSPDEGDTGQ